MKEGSRQPVVGYGQGTRCGRVWCNRRTHRESQMMRPAGRRGRWVWEAPDGGQIGGVAVGWNNNEPD